MNVVYEITEINRRQLQINGEINRTQRQLAAVWICLATTWTALGTIGAILLGWL